MLGKSVNSHFCRSLTISASPSIRFVIVLAALATTLVLLQGCYLFQDSSVGLNVSPNSLVVAPSHQQQFAALVTGTSNSGVVWTSTGGTVSPDGLFTAPSNGNVTVILTATSLADRTRTATATVTVKAAGTGSNTNTNTNTATCGPPKYNCSRSDAAILVATAPPQLGANAAYYGGHKGAGTIAVDPDYGNRILRVTDGLTSSAKPGLSFNTPASAEKNVTSYDEIVFIAHDEGDQLCLFQFKQAAFQAAFRGCHNGAGGGSGADFGYTSTDNNAIYNWIQGKLYRFVIDRSTWTISADPTFNGGLGYFDADSPQCLNGQIAANNWGVNDRALSSDDQTAIAAIGAGQDKDQYYVVWKAGKGCQWMDVKNWIVSNGWNTGMSNPVAISWKSGLSGGYGNTGGVHNAQLDRSGAFGVLTVNGDNIGHKLFWTIGTNSIDDTCISCYSHWTCDFGVCFWNNEIGSGYAMSSLPIGSSTITLDMNNLPALGTSSGDEHASHANASPNGKNPYLVAWDTNQTAVTQVWQNELTGVNWDGSRRTVRFNKTWNGNQSGFWSTSRCPISRQGTYALCGSDYQFLNQDRGFGNGLNQDSCDHTRNADVVGTTSCRTDVLLFELK